MFIFIGSCWRIVRYGQALTSSRSHLNLSSIFTASLANIISGKCISSILHFCKVEFAAFSPNWTIIASYSSIELCRSTFQVSLDEHEIKHSVKLPVLNLSIWLPVPIFDKTVKFWFRERTMWSLPFICCHFISLIAYCKST